MVCCTCTAMAALTNSSSRNACVSWRSRSSEVSGEPVSRLAMVCRCARHCCALAPGRPSLARRARMSVASRASSRKRSRSTRSSSTTDCRALRSMATLRSLSDWAALPNSSARAALSRLCSVRSSRVNRARSEAAPSKAAISKNAMTSSCRNENRCSMGQDGRRKAATSGRQGNVLHQDLAAQGALCGLGDGDVQHLAYQPRLALEIDHAVALGAAHQLGRVLA